MQKPPPVWRGLIVGGARFTHPLSYRARINLPAAPNGLPRITRPDRIGWQRVDVHLGMTDQRNSRLDRLGPDESVAI